MFICLIISFTWFTVYTAVILSLTPFSLSKFITLPEKYPLELINYRPETITRLIEQRRKEGRSFPESPFDYKHKVPSRHGEFRNIGEAL